MNCKSFTLKLTKTGRLRRPNRAIARLRSYTMMDSLIATGRLSGLKSVARNWFNLSFRTRRDELLVNAIVAVLTFILGHNRFIEITERRITWMLNGGGER